MLIPQPDGSYVALPAIGESPTVDGAIVNVPGTADAPVRLAFTRTVTDGHELDPRTTELVTCVEMSAQDLALIYRQIASFVEDSA